MIVCLLFILFSTNMLHSIFLRIIALLIIRSVLASLTSVKCCGREIVVDRVSMCAMVKHRCYFPSAVDGKIKQMWGYFPFATDGKKSVQTLFFVRADGNLCAPSAIFRPQGRKTKQTW